MKEPIYRLAESGLIVSGRWRGHYMGCLSNGCEATRCMDGPFNLWERKRWLDARQFHDERGGHIA